MAKSVLVMVFVALLFTLTIIVSSVPGAAALCMVDVYELETTGSLITGNIRNTGDVQASVSYGLFVEEDGDIQATLIKNGSILMDPDQSHAISHTYSFGTGHYMIMLEADADCGASDVEEMGHIVIEGYLCSSPAGTDGQTRCDYASRDYLECTDNGWEIIAHDEDDYCYVCPNVCGDGECNCGETTATCTRDCGTGRCQPGYMNEYRCSGDTRQRRFRFNNCSEEWRAVEECEHGCTGGECNTGPGEVAGCGVKINTFDYLSSISGDGRPYVTATVENTGEDEEDITIVLKVGDAVKGSHSETLDSGGIFTKTIDYYRPPTSGDYKIELEATADCGSTDSANATLSVGAGGGLVVEPPEPIIPPQPQLQTSVDFYPTVIDVVAGKSKAIVLDIDSSTEQVFTTTITGAPAEWFEYQWQVFVAREKSTYVYVTPQTAGTYELTISVSAGSEGLDFSKQVYLYVAPTASEQLEGTYIGYVMEQIGNAINFALENVWMVVSLIIIALLVIIAIGHKHLKTEYEDLLPH